jgi:hypothetical protein
MAADSKLPRKQRPERREYKRCYYLEHRDRILERLAQKSAEGYYHSEQYRQIKARYRETHPEQVRACHERYRSSGKRAAYHASYYERNADRIRERVRRNYWAKKEAGLILPRPRVPAPARVELRYPYQLDTGVEGFDLLSVINNLVPRELPDAVRGDVCQTLALRVLSGEFETPSSEDVRTCIREEFRFLPNRFHVSVDADEYVRTRVDYLAAQLATAWSAALTVK